MRLRRFGGDTEGEDPDRAEMFFQSENAAHVFLRFPALPVTAQVDLDPAAPQPRLRCCEVHTGQRDGRVFDPCVRFLRVRRHDDSRARIPEERPARGFCVGQRFKDCSVTDNGKAAGLQVPARRGQQTGCEDPAKRLFRDRFVFVSADASAV